MHPRPRWPALTASLVLAGLALAACSPALDWRTFSWPQGGFSVLLPGKPVEDTREVDVGALKLTLHLFSVRVEEGIWAAGYADLPPGLALAGREQLLVDAENAYRRNVGAAMPAADAAAHAASNTVSSTASDATGLLCRNVEARGQAARHDLVLSARLCASTARYYPLISIGPVVASSGTATSDIASFLASLRVE